MLELASAPDVNAAVTKSSNFINALSSILLAMFEIKESWNNMERWEMIDNRQSFMLLNCTEIIDCQLESKVILGLEKQT